MSDEEPVTNRYKGDGGAVEGMLTGPNVKPEEQSRVEASELGPGGILPKEGPEHAENVVTDHGSNPDVPDGPIHTIKERRAPPPEQLVQELPSYEMNHPKRVLCLIFNNETFHETLELDTRYGSSVDADNLKAAFKGLGFSVEVLKDKMISEIRQKLRSAAQLDHSQSDCFVCVFLSHGEDGRIYGSDATESIKKLTDLFRGHNCQTLKGKPKLFFIQACRGEKHERPVEPPNRPDGPGKGGEEEPMDVTDVGMDTGVRPTLPAGADFLMAYSTSEGFYSFRNERKGSWFIQDLCLALKKHGTNMEIQQILTLVNRMVSCREVECTKEWIELGAKQMPCVLSMLTKKLIFTKKLNTSHVPV